MERKATSVIVTLACACIIAAQSITVKAAPVHDAVATLTLCNQQRVAAGLPTLKWNVELASAAAVRSTEVQKVWSHIRPNGQDYYTADPAIYGENLSKDCNSPATCVANWMNSPLHRANILDPTYKSCGIAIYELNGSWYCAEEFGY